MLAAMVVSTRVNTHDLVPPDHVLDRISDETERAHRYCGDAR